MRLLHVAVVGCVLANLVQTISRGIPEDKTVLPCSGTPSTYREVVNLTASTETAYRITGGFRRASCFKSLKERYKFSRYRVILMSPYPIGLVKDFVNDSFIEADGIPADGDEYATFTLDGIRPGTYFLQLRPFNPSTYAYQVSGPNKSEMVNLTDLTVRGMDYTPEPPKLSIFSPSNVSVRYKVAPEHHYVSHYILKFHTATNKDITLTEKDYPIKQADWYWKDYTLNGTLPDAFETGQSMVVEVIPQLEPRLCEPAGYCNIDDYCNPCSSSISLEEVIPSQSSNAALKDTASVKQPSVDGFHKALTNSELCLLVNALKVILKFYQNVISFFNSLIIYVAL